MKKIFLILLCWSLSLNLMGAEVDKFENYFNSDIEFQLLKDYKNIFSSTVPIRFYRTENDKSFEFVGVYELEAYDEIYSSFIKIFGNEKGYKDPKVWFEGSEEKGVINIEKDKILIKYLKKKN